MVYLLLVRSSRGDSHHLVSGGLGDGQVLDDLSAARGVNFKPSIFVGDFIFIG